MQRTTVRRRFYFFVVPTSIEGCLGPIVAVVVGIVILIALPFVILNSIVGGISRDLGIYGTLDPSSVTLKNPHFYTDRAKGVVFGAPTAVITQDDGDTGFGHNYTFYFHLTINNTDTKDHAVAFSYRFTYHNHLDALNEDRLIVLSDDQTLTLAKGASSTLLLKKSHSSYPPINMSSVAIYNITVDGLPAEDPRDIWPTLSFGAIPGKTPFQLSLGGGSQPGCTVTIANADVHPHVLAVQAVFTYTYIDLGETKTAHATFTLRNINADPDDNTVLVLSHVPYAPDWGSATDSGFGGINQERIKSLVIDHIIVTAADRGSDQVVPSSLNTQTYAVHLCPFVS